MKFGELKSIGHNIAASLASGIGILIGVCDMDIFGEASSSPEGYIAVDFLTGSTTGAEPSAELAKAILRYSGALDDLCKKHGVTRSVFRTLTAQYGVDRIYGDQFKVTLEDQNGRKSIQQFVGSSGKHFSTEA